jgi:hypothetical protein
VVTLAVLMYECLVIHDLKPTHYELPIAPTGNDPREVRTHLDALFVVLICRRDRRR